jgi:DNA-binding transcriptional ArsR family regulator
MVEQVNGVPAVLKHPLRIRIVEKIVESEAGRLSPSEVSGLVGAPLGNVSYHVRQLHDAGVLKLVKKTPRRGAIEHYYGVVEEALVREAADLARFAMRLGDLVGQGLVAEPELAGVPA